MPQIENSNAEKNGLNRSPPLRDPFAAAGSANSSSGLGSERHFGAKRSNESAGRRTSHRI
jgi:hypothetical protein